MKHACFVLLSLVTAACASGGDTPEAQYLAVLHAGLPRGVQILVVPPELPETLRSAAARVRPVLDPSAVPHSERSTLPTGYFVLDAVVIDGDTAVIDGLLGPVPVAQPGEILTSCGTRYRIVLHRSTDGSWSVGPLTVTAC